MNRASVLATLKQLEPRLRARGVAALYLFGSYARDEARPDSDVDILVETEDGAATGFFGVPPATDLVEEAMPGVEISMVTRDNIVPLYLPYIERSAIRIF
jgi:uncharacterized protein